MFYVTCLPVNLTLIAFPDYNPLKTQISCVKFTTAICTSLIKDVYLC